MKQLLSSFPAFRVLEDRDFNWIKSVAQQKNYKSGTLLIQLDMDLLEGTAIAGKRFNWMIQQLRR